MGMKSEQQNSRTAEYRTSGKRTAELQNMVRQAHHERDCNPARPEPVEGTAEGRRMVFGNAPVISDEALASCRAEITDEWLDFMGERYRRLAIRYWTGVEFHKYLFYPEVLECEADKLRGYVAFRLVDSDDTVGLAVSTTN